MKLLSTFTLLFLTALISQSQNVFRPDYQQFQDDQYHSGNEELRTSNAIILFQDAIEIDNEFEWDYNVIGSASRILNSTNSAIDLIIGTTMAESIERITRKQFSIPIGKSARVNTAFIANATKNGLVQEIGFANNNNGGFLRINENGFHFIHRNIASGTVTETTYTLGESTNLSITDRFNTAQSYYNKLDLTNKVHVLTQEFQYFGGGRIRQGFILDGKIIYMNEINTNNITSESILKTVRLPLYYKIVNSSTTNNASTLSCLASSLQIDGSYEIRKFMSTVSNGSVIRNATTELVPVLAIRPAIKNEHDLFNKRLISIESLFSLSDTRRALIQIEQILDSSLINVENWGKPHHYSAVEYASSVTQVISSKRKLLFSEMINVDDVKGTNNLQLPKISLDSRNTQDEIFLISAKIIEGSTSGFSISANIIEE